MIRVLQNTILTIAFLYGFASLWGQSTNSDIFEKIYDYKDSNIVVKVEKIDKEYKISVTKEATGKVDTFNLKIIERDGSVFRNKYRISFGKLNIKYKEEYEAYFDNNVRQVYDDIFDFYNQSISFDPYTPIAGTLWVKKEFTVNNAFASNVWTPKTRKGLIYALDTINYRIWETFNSIDFTCGKLCDCDVLYKKYKLYQQLFDDKEGFYCLTKGVARSYNLYDYLYSGDFSISLFNCDTCNVSDKECFNYLNSVKTEIVTNKNYLTDSTALVSLVSSLKKLDCKSANGSCLEIRMEILALARERNQEEQRKIISGIATFVNCVDCPLSPESDKIKTDGDELIKLGGNKGKRKSDESKTDRKNYRTEYKFSTGHSQCKTGRMNNLKQLYVDRMLLSKYLRNMRQEYAKKCCDIQELEQKKSNVKNDQKKVQGELSEQRIKMIQCTNTLGNLLEEKTDSILCIDKSTDTTYTYYLRNKKIYFVEQTLKTGNKNPIVTQIYGYVVINKDTTDSHKLDSIKSELQISKSKVLVELNTSPDYSDPSKLTKLIESVQKFTNILDSICSGMENGKNAWNLANQMRRIKDKLDSIYTNTRLLSSYRDSLLNYEKLIDGSLKTMRENYSYIAPPFITDSVDLEFNQGFLKGITVFGKYDGKRYKLVNRFPIPFSVFTDMEKFRYIQLYEPMEYKFTVPLIRVLDYDPKRNLNMEDISPVDKALVITADKPQQLMYKEKSIDILKGRIFTDLVGIGSSSPNGLIQTELSRKFNLFTRYFPIFYRSPGKVNGYKIHCGLFNYIEPILLISKIEDKNRLAPRLVADYGSPPAKFISTVDYLKYATLYFKPVNVNISSIHLPTIKSSFHCDVGVSWLMTGIADTTVTVDTNTTITPTSTFVNSFSFNACLIYKYQGDGRFGFTITNDFIYLKALSDKYFQAGNPTGYKNGTDIREFNWLHNVQFNAFYKPFKRDYGDLFFRFSYYSTIGNPSQNYMQIQLGVIFRVIKN